MENKDILETFSEREWELAKIYINTRINGKGEKFSYQSLSKKTLYFLGEIEKGFVRVIDKERYEKQEEAERERIAEKWRGMYGNTKEDEPILLSDDDEEDKVIHLPPYKSEIEKESLQA